MGDDERKLFRELVGEVEPLRGDTPVSAGRPAERTPGTAARRRAAEGGEGASRDYLDDVANITRVKPGDELSWKRDGVQNGVFRKLRLGQYPVESRLDLHRMTVAMARRALLDFVNDGLAANLRCLLVSHGRGEGRENPALLKSCVNHWLRQMDAVLAFHSAQRHDGGFGATYVMLRKSRHKRDENRERYSKRGG